MDVGSDGWFISSVGAGPEVDIRLTESEIPPLLGDLRWANGASEVDYLHRSLGRDVNYARYSGWGEDRIFPHINDKGSGFSRFETGDVAITSDRVLDQGELFGVCSLSSTDPEGSSEIGAWSSLQVFDNELVWLMDGQGYEYRALSLPTRGGSIHPLGTSGVIYRAETRTGYGWTDGDALWLVPDRSVLRDCQSLSSMDEEACLADNLAEVQQVGISLFPWWWSNVAGVPSSAVAALGLDEQLWQTADIRVITRSLQDRGFVQLGSQAPQPIVLGDLGEQLSPGRFHIFRRDPRSRATSPYMLNGTAPLRDVPLLKRLVSPDAKRDPRLARAPDLTGRLYLVHCSEPERCPGAGCAEEVGARTLKSNDWLVAGLGSYYRINTPESSSDVLELMVEIPPTGRVNLLSSLSSGRLEAKNHRIDLPRCSSENTASLLLRGKADSSHLADGVEINHRERHFPDNLLKEDVPLPAWYARQHARIQAGELLVDLVEVCVEDSGELRLTPRGGRLAGEAELPASVSPGESFRLAGHRLRYSSDVPLIEQRLSLFSFLSLLLLGGGYAATRYAWSHSAAAVSAIVVLLGLMVLGACTQMHQSASDNLLGSADYIQRHLLTGYFALVALISALELASREGERWSVRLWSVHQIVTVGAAVLSGWLLFDLLVWQLLQPAELPISAVAKRWQLNAVIRVIAVTVFMMTILGFRQLLGRMMGARVERIWSWITERFTRLQAWAEGLFHGAPGQQEPLWRQIIYPPGGGSLLLGLLILFSGIFFWETGRSILGGFDLKPAEFAPVVLGLGWSTLLVNLSNDAFGAENQLMRQFIPLVRAGLWLAGVIGMVVLLFGMVGDLGPLMVMTPALIATLLPWAWDWMSTENTREVWQVLIARVSLFILGGLVMIVSASSFVKITVRFHSLLIELPLIGGSIERAIERFQTLDMPWFTRSGEWSIGALWRAAGFYGADAERYLSNLHSDLAYLAVLQTYGSLIALGLLALFGLLIALLFWMGEEALRAGQRQMAIAQTEPDIKVALRLAQIGFFCNFAAFYVLVEMVVHIGTCFNTMPQTGITLPWISSGGSAATGFAILVGTAVGLYLYVCRTFPSPEVS